jgi:hypothetical protein
MSVFAVSGAIQKLDMKDTHVQMIIAVFFEPKEDMEDGKGV